MNVKVYGNKIIAPCKCGTRYLDKIWNVYEDISEMTIFRNPKWKRFEGYYIYRPPMEHLVSALHTEIITREDWQSVDDIIDLFLRPIGTTHWSPYMYKGLWEYISANKRVKGIPLSQLTTLVKKLGMDAPKWDKSEYEFRHLDDKWLSKETVLKDIQRDYEIEWEWLVSCVEEDGVYYDKIVNCEWKVSKLL
jgi:hypothetical protein